MNVRRCMARPGGKVLSDAKPNTLRMSASENLRKTDLTLTKVRCPSRVNCYRNGLSAVCPLISL